MKIAKRSEKGESKNRPVATNFQFLKILAPLRQLLVGACLPQTLLGTSTANWNFTYLDNGNVNFPDNKKYSRSKPTIIRIPPTTLMPIRLTLLFFIILFAKTNSSAPTTIIKTDINGYMSFLLSNSDLSVLHQPNLPRHYTKNASKRCRSSIFTVAR